MRAAGSGDPAQDRSETRERRASLVTWVTIRTRFLDDVALESSAGGCRQVVILGAGLDARAFRLDWPANVRLFELDLPAVLEVKEQAEGLLAYLSPQASDALVARAGRLSAPTSRMGLTLASAERLRAWREAHPDGSTGKDDYVALWRSVAPDKAVEWLASHGWKARVFDVAERSAAYGRPLEEHARPATGARLVDATRAA